MKYIIDTCVWRDFYEARNGRRARNLSQEAAKLFSKIIMHKDIILFSKALVWEFKEDYNRFYNILNFLTALGILQKIDISSEEYREAKLLSKKRKLPFVDCLFAVQARNHQAVLISQDKHIVVELSDIAETKRPAYIN